MDGMSEGVTTQNLHIAAKLVNIAEGLQDCVHEASVAQISQSRASVQLDVLVIDAVVVVVSAVAVDIDDANSLIKNSIFNPQN